MQMRPLWSPVPAWMPILLSSGLLWPEPGAGLQHSTHTHTQKPRTQHSWGHSLSTSGARLLPPQPDKSPRDTQKKAPGPQRERGPIPSSSSTLLQATPASCYYPTPTGFGQRGGKEDEGKESGKKRERRPKGRDGKREKEMGGRKRHLASFIWWTMINGLAFSWSLLPQRSLWASPDKRVFEGERTPQILLFVPDRA